jgi:hypothetical protein
MADWFKRLFNAFIEFRPARNWKCRYHYGKHYQDEIRTKYESGKRVSEWYLHDNLIARLEPIEYPVFNLYLTTAGYSTPTTLSRLNDIIWLFKLKLNIDLGITFRLKYDGAVGKGYPDHTYIEYHPRNTEYKTSRVNLQFNALTREVLAVDLPRDCEIRYFMNHKKLSSVRRIYYKLEKIDGALFDVVYKLRNLDCDNSELLSKIDEFRRKVYSFVELFGLPYGIYAKFSVDAVKNVLKELIKEGEAILPKAREVLAETVLLNT